MSNIKATIYLDDLIEMRQNLVNVAEDPQADLGTKISVNFVIGALNYHIQEAKHVHESEANS